MREAKQMFLTAEWRDLAMLNYEVDASLLERYVPPGTDLDSFERKTCVSLVGFCFSRTRLWGKIAVPLHTEFAEVNLRFYVRRREGSGEGFVLSPRLCRKERSLGRRGLCMEKTTDGFRWSIGLRKAVW